MFVLLIIFGAKYLYILTILIALIFFFYLPKDKKKGFALLAVIALPCVYICAKIAGHFYFDPRPFVTGHFTPLIPHPADNGFVSDHMLLTGAIAMIVFFYNKKTGAILWVAALLVGLSRVLAGIHHPIDILGAAVISAAVPAIIYHLLKIKNRAINQ
jgi:undecaprenyl-diphosphatase